ncbi:MAG: hypothetical protein M0Q87_15315, partial [Ottowia sp.]|nr:hypothetical protein [Ottowia sp.]
ASITATSNGNIKGTWDGVTIPVNKGGTGQTTLTSGAILVGNGTGNVKMTKPTAGHLLQANGTSGVATANLTSYITGVTNQINVSTNGSTGGVKIGFPSGGVTIPVATRVDNDLEVIGDTTIGTTTAATSLNVYGTTTINGNTTIGGTPAANNRNLTVNGDLDATGKITGTWNGDTIPVSHGGTGRATLTSGAILVGNGDSNVSLLAKPTTNNKYLKSSGTNYAPAWGSIAYGDITGTPTIGISSGNIPRNDGNLANNKLIKATSNGISTDVSLTSYITGTANQIDVSANGTTGGVKIGFPSGGVTIPVATTLSSTLSVSGNTTIGGTTTLNGTTNIKGDTTIGTTSAAKTLTVNGNTTIGTDAAKKSFTVNGNALAVTASSNVGIGTASPTTKLHVVGATTITGNTTITGTTTLNGTTNINGDTTIGGDTPATNKDLTVNGNTTITGNTTIGTTSTNNTLTVNGKITGTWNGDVISANKGGTGRATLTSGAILVGNGTGNIKMTKPTAGHLLQADATNGVATASLTNYVTGTANQIDVSANGTTGGVKIGFPTTEDMIIPMNTQINGDLGAETVIADRINLANRIFGTSLNQGEVLTFHKDRAGVFNFGSDVMLSGYAEDTNLIVNPSNALTFDTSNPLFFQIETLLNFTIIDRNNPTVIFREETVNIVSTISTLHIQYSYLQKHKVVSHHCIGMNNNFGEFGIWDNDEFNHSEIIFDDNSSFSFDNAALISHILIPSLKLQNINNIFGTSQFSINYSYRFNINALGNSGAEIYFGAKH